MSRFYSRDVSQKAVIDLRRQLDAVELGLRERDVRLVPQADVGRELGDALLDLAVARAARLRRRRARGFVDQAIELPDRSSGRG